MFALHCTKKLLDRIRLHRLLIPRMPADEATKSVTERLTCFQDLLDRIVARKSVRFNSIQWCVLILENLLLERAATAPPPSISLRESPSVFWPGWCKAGSVRA